MEGRFRDYAHWFKIFLLLVIEHWKECVFFRNKLYLDLEVQMGTVAGTHLGKCESFLLTEIAMTHAVVVFKNSVVCGDVPTVLAKSERERRAIYEIEQATKLLFLVFQDDMLELAAEAVARNGIEETEEQVICGRFGI